VASQTDSAALVALGATLQWLPPLVFGLFAGALTDRVDPRLIVGAVNAVRCVVLVLLVTSIVVGAVSVVVVLLALLLLATAESFADNASQTLMPLLLRRDDLAVGNARLQTGFITLNQLAGPFVGAALFSAGAAWPFATEAVLVAAAAVLVSRVALPARKADGAGGRSVFRDIVEGLRWTRHHAAVRTLVLTIFTFNITFGAAWSVLVLYATQRLGMGPIGFGSITLVQALGGLAGTVVYGWITRRVSLGNLMRVGLVLETLTHAALALTTVPWVALVIFFVFGAHMFVWSTTSVTVRQRAVPDGLQGRVGSVNVVGTYAGLVVGSGIGGLLAQQYGVTAPFWFAFAGSAVFVVLIWRQLSHIAHDDQEQQSTTSG
jgi:MFS family permease